MKIRKSENRLKTGPVKNTTKTPKSRVITNRKISQLFNDR
jgi:hypothetical protein